MERGIQTKQNLSRRGNIIKIRFNEHEGETGAREDKAAVSPLL